MVLEIISLYNEELNNVKRLRLSKCSGVPFSSSLVLTIPAPGGRSKNVGGNSKRVGGNSKAHSR